MYNTETDQRWIPEVFPSGSKENLRIYTPTQKLQVCLIAANQERLSCMPKFNYMVKFFVLLKIEWYTKMLVSMVLVYYMVVEEYSWDWFPGHHTSVHRDLLLLIQRSNLDHYYDLGF